MHPRFRLVPGALALLLVAACGTTPIQRMKGKDTRQGEIVQVTGTVTDALGQPVSEAEVAFRASRESYDYLRLRKRTPVEREVTTTTSADGSFEIDWPWDPGFNRFEVVFGITVGEPGGERFHVLARQDLTKRMSAGSPVVATAQIADTSFLETFLEFRSELDTDAEHEVYREAGKPDKVRRRVSKSGPEADWWYFGLGKVYRFRNGELTEVEEFEPVTGLDRENNKS